MEDLIRLDRDAKFYGVYFGHPGAMKQFWAITCPCGLMVTYPVNELPLIDTPHPCQHPDHWSVKIHKSEGTKTL